VGADDRGYPDGTEFAARHAARAVGRARLNARPLDRLRICRRAVALQADLRRSVRATLPLHGEMARPCARRVVGGSVVFAERPRRVP
jgi:hypothetical protein